MAESQYWLFSTCTKIGRKAGEFNCGDEKYSSNMFDRVLGLAGEWRKVEKGGE